MALLPDCCRPKSMAVAFVVGLFFFCTQAVTGYQDISYVESANENLGNFFMSHNYTVRATGASHILTKRVTDCSCKSACMAINCKAWSVVYLKEGAECRLAKRGPIENPPAKRPGSVYYFLADSVGDYGFDPQDLMYVEMPNGMLYADAKSLCTNIPGHRLLMPKTKTQFDFYYDKFGNTFVVDLIRYDNNFIWGDGTPYIDSNESPMVIDDEGSIFVSWKGALNGYYNIQYKAICQANPFSVEW